MAEPIAPFADDVRPPEVAALHGCCLPGPHHPKEHAMRATHLPTWAAPDVIVDDLTALADHRARLGISRRDARALRRVARVVAVVEAGDQALGGRA